MNREIKFRGLNNNGHWRYGFVVFQMDQWLICDTVEIPPCMSDPCGDTRFIKDVVDPKSIGEYTGLKDKDGKEIYEGDIITFSTRRYHFGRDKGLQTIKFKSVVTWEDGGFMVSEKQENDTFICAHDKDDAHESLYEVIGNIYEKEKP